MIYVDLQRILFEIAKRTGRKLTLSEVSERSGVHRNIISQINNNPTDRIASDYLAKLAEFFFHVLRHSPQKPEKSDKELMNWVFSNLVSMYPDHPVYQEKLSSIEGTGGARIVLPPENLWKIFENESKDTPADELLLDDFKEFSEVIEEGSVEIVTKSFAVRRRNKIDRELTASPKSKKRSKKKS
jgi:transcriptional regulator with XRE-family HTH domain